MYQLTKEFTFEASHQLIGHDGKCKRLHGHSWRARIEVDGPALEWDGPKRGMLIDYYDISKVVAPFIEDYLDHWHLNDTLQTERPTSEFIARWLFEKLKPQLPMLAAVTIFETCTSSCRYAPL